MVKNLIMVINIDLTISLGQYYFVHTSITNLKVKSLKQYLRKASMKFKYTFFFYITDSDELLGVYIECHNYKPDWSKIVKNCLNISTITVIQKLY